MNVRDIVKGEKMNDVFMGIESSFFFSIELLFRDVLCIILHFHEASFIVIIIYDVP